MSVRNVTSGSAARKPPNLSLRFAASDTKTTTAAVSMYLVKSQSTVAFKNYLTTEFSGKQTAKLAACPLERIVRTYLD
jgi:hypothetical protein